MDNKKTLSELAKILSGTGELPEEKRREVLNALQTAAREAEIEAALESVRARSMAMHSSDELNDVLRVFFRQFEVLGIKPVTAFLSLFDMESNTFTYRSTSKAGSRMQTQQVVDLDSLDIWQDLAEKWKNDKQDAVEVIYYPREVLPELFQLFEETFSAMPEKERIRAEDFPDGGYAVQGYCKFGYIGFNHYRPPTEEEKQILIRFAREFGRLYQRFLDVQKAEAQAREAQIEAALERVRARTMAMHNSSELQDVIHTVYRQFLALDMDITGGAFIVINSDIESEIVCWGAGGTADYVEKVHLPYIDMPIYTEMVAGIKNGPGFFEESFTEKEKQAFFKELFRNPPYADAPAARKKEVMSRPGGYTRSCVVSEYTSIFIINHHGRSFTEQENNILKRMGKVFEQTYTRFLDLEKAEAQAREAEIQLALERIRAASMAMHKTEELGDVVKVLFKEFSSLDLDFYQVWINIFLLDEGYSNCWFSPVEGVIDEAYTAVVPLEPFEDSSIKSWRAGEPFSYLSWRGRKAVDAISKELTEMTGHPSFWQIQRKKQMERMEVLDCNHKYGVVAMAKNSEITEEDKSMLSRFTRVFELTYTRFLDLQKAENQAREAQIEAALERVRSATMAMVHSSQLYEVITKLCQQLNELGIRMDVAMINEVMPGTKDWHLWIAISSSSSEVYQRSEQVHIPYLRGAAFDRLEKARKAGLKQYSDQLTKSQKDLMFDHYFNKSNHLDVPESRKALIYSASGLSRTIILNKNFHIQIFRYSKEAFSQEENNLLMRFGKVFEQSYTRFLDIKRADEQAREAQIEAALERVRARTMAMHRSKELGEVAAVLFEQINSLGTSLERLNIGIVREDEGVFEWWSTEQGGQQIDHLFKGSIEEPTTISKVYAAWKQGKKSLEIDLSGKELQQWIKYLKEEIRMPFKDELIRDRRVHTGAFFKHGGLLVSSPEPLSTESVKLLERFGTVFEQTYTRFLDLQKAEAQARESEIQLALERIRARTMAMQESTELTEVLTVVFQQLKLLGVETVWAHLTLLDLENDRFTYRMTGRNGERIMAEETIALDASEHWAHVAESLKASNPEPVNRFEVPPEGLDALWELFDGIFSKLPEGDQVSPKDFPNGLYATQAYCKFGFLGLNQTRESTPEEADILLRFATEFGRVYQRFLDLQQAEERAREAQIETALERVRARSMAMHQSSELNVILSKVFEELTSLEIEMERAVIWIYHPENRSVHWWAANPEAESGSECYFISDQDDPVYNEYWKAWEERRTKDLYILEGEYKENWTQILFNDTGLKRLPEVVKAAMVRPEKIFLYNTFNDFGVLFIARLEPLPDEKFSILERFGKVFNQCYTRFQDIQKAEAQARESEIQLALERVRARTMAMHHSKELLEVIRVIAEQLEKLDIRYNNVSLGPNILEGGLKFWLAGYNMPEPFIIDVPYIDHPAPNRVRKATKEGISFFADVLTKEENRIFVRHILKHTDPKYYTEEIEEKLLNAPGYARSTFIFNNINLYVGNYKAQPYSEEENAIIGRFARVFEQAYTRFLDLEKAEAQAREAEIETALERVRAKTMAMQKTEDIRATVAAFFGELTGLGLDKHLVCGINILSQSERGQLWAATDGHDSDETVYQGFLDMSSHPLLKHGRNCWERGEPNSLYILEGSDIPEYYKVLNAAPDFPVQLDTEDVPEIEYYWNVHFRDGYLFSITQSPLPEEIRSILERFASAFSQTFTRYLDLQKAEAQARESQIEAALERVRSKTMAMHNSQDVGETVTTLFDEVTRLGLDTSIRCGIGILEGYEDEEGGMMETWSAASAEEGSVDLKTGLLTMSIHPLLRGVKKAWENNESIFSYILKGADLTRYYDLLNKEPRYPLYTDLDTLQPPHFHNSFYFREGLLFSFTRNPLTAEATKILGRFASLFGQTYRRYLDLKNAEKLAREAQIETAMERIRSRALAMRSSDEIMDVITELRRQIDSLGQLDLEASVVHLYTEGSSTFQSIAAVRPPGEAGEIVLANVEFPVDAMDPIRHMIDMYRSEQAEYTIEFTKEMAEQWQQVMLEHAPMIAERRVGFVDNRRLSDRSEYWNFADFTGGSLLLVTHSPASGDTLEVLRKAAYVFDLAYRRHLDLIEAEAREQEAVKQASLDRVRAEISGMRSTSDLERITPLIWKELNTLEVPFFRCGVFIIDEKEQKIHSYLSNPQGESLAVWHSDFSLIPLFDDLVENWKKQEMYLTEWNREEFLNFSGVLMDHGLVNDRERYQSGKDAPEHLVLQLVPFKQGMLYVGSDTHLEATQMELVRALALAFSVAYARYEDFNQLEQAIGELKATQSQLIQSEKMASLGELTAGIAHEIKNPLNFVNNFSEVSRELLEELMEEIRKGDMEEVEALTGDLLQNLEKIAHHGRRADSIVKGMLQHSRSGDGKKEPTDLNALADEYMRLAYHGLRAKDKSFNATIQTDFDPKAGKLEVVPQDMGRVLLNLLTNAFYAVTEKAQEAGTDYKPTVSIRTARENGQVTVSVKDNGSGIPEKVREKIFQPFFTTKPTGQGTGLGLSLSYDIVTKGHGGTLQVASEEGKGTEFTIKLPSA